MKKNDRKALVALCDTEWIRAHRSKNDIEPGDIYYDYQEEDFHIVDNNDLIKNMDFENKRWVWIPVGFDLSRCQMELDVLLQEAGRFSDEDEMGDAYHDWRERTEGENEVKMTGNHIILKLEWLEWLLAKGKK